ncbi:hypothetical protein [Bosea sp. CS1GBMeth4]|uniref:hypothetical protein n=1 Tax=Bosea sp. CS1GBMeth4 TaxID=1892849 RepID=UPI001645B5EB|nr:hypothetical protein [Bosea sp. CS1GBMeth4]
MSEVSVAIAQSLVGMRTAATRQAVQIEMLKQNAESEQALVALLRQASERQKALLPAGQGSNLDISA